ncbi:growth/differentiation factor 11-like [Rhipicephalus sanguineus]|uniref:growth/differentiation factor 11-like n=1 Tax=Rhipicephalus sanguineus TaxID=34632 RepID=UPI0020C23B95|nr:growth/differentiation factor 11-like [Rhipicephalus sanguineus]
MAGGALQAALAAALLLAGCGGRCPAGVDGHGGGGGGGAPSSAALAGDDQRQLKLDAVRHQILSKLSLRERPPQRRESAPPLARELALEALRRVHLLPEPRALEDQGAPDPRQEDDYYGRTAEIIAFAEPGQFLFPSPPRAHHLCILLFIFLPLSGPRFLPQERSSSRSSSPLASLPPQRHSHARRPLPHLSRR